MQINGNQPIAQPGLDSVSDNQPAPKLAGKASNGETVRVQTNTSSPMQRAADMAEEIVQFVKDNKTDLKDRKVKKGDDESQQMLQRVQKIQTLQNVQEIKDFLQQLKSNPNLTREQIHEKLKEAFDDDVLHEFMGLSEAVHFFDEIGDEESANLLKSIRNEFFSENKVAIKSGINISEAAAREAEESGLSNTRELRETHVKLLDHVQDHSTLSQAYTVLAETHGEENFLTSVQVQQKLLSTDLLSFNPSTSSERLKAVIDDLAELKVLVGLHDGCLETEEQAKRIFPAIEFNEHVLMPQLLNIVDQQWVTEADFSKLPELLNATDLEAQIFVMNKVDALVRDLPEEIFSNIETKQNMQAAVMEAMDSFVEQENEEEVGEAVDAGDTGYGILGDIGLAEAPAEKRVVEPKAETNPTTDSAAKPGTADYIAQKAAGQLPGQSYQSVADVLGDVQKLSGKPAELQALIDGIESLKETDFVGKEELDQLEDYAKDLLEMSKPQSGLHATNRRSITVRGE